MTTAGKTLVIASSGTAFGNYKRTRRLASSGTAFSNYKRTRKLASVTVSDYREVAFPLSGSSALPNAVYATAAMTTAGKTFVIVSSGASFGQYARVYRLAVLLDRVIGQAAAETAPAGMVSGVGLERSIGSGAEAAPAALISSSGSVPVPFTGTSEETAPAGLISGSVSVSVPFTGAAAETSPAGLISGAGLRGFIGAASETAPAGFIQVDGRERFPGAWETAPPGVISGTGLERFAGALETAPAGLIDAAGLTYDGTVSAAPGVTQVLIEVAAHGEQGAAPPLLVVTQDVIEWALHPANTLTVTQDVIEWALHPANALRVTQSCIEVAYKGRRQPKVIARYQRALP
jgi:hypothetical protein